MLCLQYYYSFRTDLKDLAKSLYPFFIYPNLSQWLWGTELWTHDEMVGSSNLTFLFFN
jgi:hypothetical protein